MKLMEMGALPGDQLIKALCNTLLHSLWQGVILAVIAGLIVVFTKKASAAMRYNLLAGALTLFAVTTAVTFMVELQKAAANKNSNITYATDTNAAADIPNVNPGATIHTVVTPIILAKPAAPVMQQATSEDITTAVISYLNTHYNVIVLIWFLIICAKSIQMAVGLQGVFHLKRSKVYTVGKTWENKLSQLAAQLQIGQAVRLLESGIAKVPMAIGHLKPVILIPVGLINSLSAEEVEAILVHELAHIRRRDYLVNLLQSLMEIVFFFNPAVLWISKLIKAERENCCDDIALAETGNKAGYINALVSCEEHQLATPVYSMALGGSKNTLLTRVKRMVQDSNQSLNLVEKTLLTLCLVCAGLGMAAFSSRTAPKHHLQDKVQKAKPTLTPISTQIKSDSSRAPHIMVYKSKDFSDGTTLKTLGSDRGRHYIAYVFKRNGMLYQINMINDGVISLMINEKQVPADKLDSYQSEINELLSEYNAADAQNEANKASTYIAPVENNAAAQSNVSQAQPGVNVGFPPDANVSAHPEIPDFGDTLVKYGVIKDKRFIHAKFNNQALIINGIKQPDDVFRMLLSKYIKNPGETVNITYTNNGQDDNTTSDAKGVYNGSDGNAWNGSFPRNLENKHPGPYDNFLQQRSAEIGGELVKENLVGNKNNFSYHLNRGEFTIDGVRQPEELHRRIIDKYFKPDDEFDINYNNHDPGLYDYQKRAEANQERRIIDQMQREGLITNRKALSFTLMPKTFVINGMVQSAEVFERYRQQYIPANAGDDWVWNYPDGIPGYYAAQANRYRNLASDYQQSAQERQRVEADRDKKLVADLLKDGLITDANNVTFKLNQKDLTINGKKQSADLYKKYKEKYVPNDSGGDWSWTYSHHE